MHLHTAARRVGHEQDPIHALTVGIEGLSTLIDAPPLIFPMYSAPGFVKRRGALDAAAGARR
jgi:hypothetical protein